VYAAGCSDDDLRVFDVEDADLFVLGESADEAANVEVVLER
jgi:hypothetical protein